MMKELKRTKETNGESFFPGKSKPKYFQAHKEVEIPSAMAYLASIAELSLEISKTNLHELKSKAVPCSMYVYLCIRVPYSDRSCLNYHNYYNWRVLNF